MYSTASNSWARSTEYDYDVLNNISKLSFSYNNGTSNTTRYSYTEDNLPLTTLLDNNETLNYKYDGLNRLTQKVLYTSTKVITDYTYLPSLTNLEAYTTNMIDTEVSNAFAYSYYYDNNGNITKIQNGTKQSDGTYTYSASSGNKYEYDRYNQLTKDTDYDNGTVTTYTYDTNGNITQKSVAYGSDTTTTSYTYNDSQGWSDLLTSYNGEAITYDAIGNPLTYRDGMTMEWQNGRELAMCDYGTAYNVYRYDLDGMRASKTIVAPGGNIKYVKYIYENGLLLQMDYDGYVFNFSYDANGSPIGFHVKNGSYIDAYYYYGLNSRGDVEALYNANGTIYAKYEYDAYGRLLGITDVDGYTISSAYDIAVLNPLRYRGYVYDTETGFYYLQSRYYDPTTCRFVNGDSQLNTDSINGFNQFAYCDNNPMMYSDPYGYKAGSYFGSIDAAMRDFAETYNIESINNNWEYGAFIYSIEVEVYVYNNTYATTLMYSYSEPFTDCSSDGVDMHPKRNTVDSEPVALAHTHAAYSFGSFNESFSFLDENLAKEGYGLDIYVATPKGKIKKYLHETGDTILIYGETWHDRRTRFWGHNCDKCAN